MLNMRVAVIPLFLLVSPLAAQAQHSRERVATAHTEAWLNDVGCSWALRSIYGARQPEEKVYYDYEYDAFDGNSFLLKYLDHPARLGLTWVDEQLVWETSLLRTRQPLEGQGLLVWMEANEVLKQTLTSQTTETLLEDTIRFFEVMEEGGDRPNQRPDPRIRFYSARVNKHLSHMGWPGRSVVEERLGTQNYQWAPAAFRYAKESTQRVQFHDATDADLTLIRKEVRDNTGAWVNTCRLRAVPVGELQGRPIEDFSEQYLRFLASYGFGLDLLTTDDPDPFPYTADKLGTGRQAPLFSLEFSP